MAKIDLENILSNMMLPYLYGFWQIDMIVIKSPKLTFEFWITK